MKATEQYFPRYLGPRLWTKLPKSIRDAGNNPNVVQRQDTSTQYK